MGARYGHPLRATGVERRFWNLTADQTYFLEKIARKEISQQFFVLIGDRASFRMEPSPLFLNIGRYQHGKSLNLFFGEC